MFEKAKSDTVFIFLHGNLASSYLWYNIISYTTPLFRSIAIGLIDFGKLGKSGID